MNRLARALVALVIGSVVLSGCDFDVYELPLPGGADVGDNPMTVTVEFENVLDLVPQSSVKVSDVTVGKVKSVEIKEKDDENGDLGYVAEVKLEIRGDTELPANATATLRQTSLLGEKFVSLDAPETGADTEKLADGDEIPIERTGKNPEIEEVLGALSLLLNGGGLDKVKTIATEVNAALENREDSVKSLLTQVSAFMGQLDANKQDIVDAIESLNELAKGVRRQQPKIDLALEELPSALLSIDRQRGDLVDMLQALDRLGDVGVRVIRKSKSDTITSIRQLQPTLTQLANAGDDLVNSFNVILTYPFVDEVVGRDPQVARNLHIGDYTNLSVELNLDLGNTEIPGIPCTPLGQIPQVGPLPDFEDLCAGAQDALADCLDNFTRACIRGLVDAVCDATPNNPICDVVGGLIGGLLGNGGLLGGGGNGANGGAGPALPGLPGLGGLGGLLNRPAVGASTKAGRGPTMGQLMAVYDPALVSLLTPGMVLR
ncbi:MCE family protein [Nocardioides sp.]|uniref:MCE family protein n=1 Tax=Nocardioides sp. TaxID=35761 RepID=UPI002723AC6D|nr:MCE family protein [Nocardioides sp.]MDO9456326.1 MCE family protein [Nocardioides sp.]